MLSVIHSLFVASLVEIDLECFLLLSTPTVNSLSIWIELLARLHHLRYGSFLTNIFLPRGSSGLSTTSFAFKKRVVLETF